MPVTYTIHRPLIRNGAIPSARGGATIVHADGKLILFGGHYFQGDGVFKYLDETWLFDHDKSVWHQITCSGDIPGSRYGHSAQIVGSRMFIFGGKGPNGAMYKDVFFLDLLEWIWVPVNTLSQGPSPRMNHASALVGRKIVIHGGWNGEENTYNDFWIFNTDSFAWMQPRTAGFAPTPRFGHSLSLLSDGRILIFGGCSISKESGVPKYHDDMRQLDTDTMIWTRPRTNGSTPTGRYGHCSLIQDESKLVLIGGWGKGGCQSSEMINNTKAHTVHILDTNTMTWNEPLRAGEKTMRHLYNHGACVTNVGIYLFGGFDGQQAVNDLNYITLASIPEDVQS